MSSTRMIHKRPAPERLELGGPVRTKSLYIGGREDEELVELLTNGPEVVSLVAPRQTGKTSALRYLRDSLSPEGKVIIDLDLRRALGTPDGSNDDAPRFLRTICAKIKERLEQTHYEEGELTEKFEIWWDSVHDTNRVDALCLFFEEFIPSIRHSDSASEILVLDEIDVFHSHGAYTDILLESIRSLYQRRKKDSISVVLAGIIPPYKLIKTTDQANFTVGRRITLCDFSDPEQYRQYVPFLKNYFSEFFVEDLIKKSTEITGGQPYLTNILLDSAIREEWCDDRDEIHSNIERYTSQIIIGHKQGRIPEPHFDAPLDILKSNPSDALDSLRALETLHNEGSLKDYINENVKTTLLTTGLIKPARDKWVFKSEVYKKFYDKAWIEKTRNLISRQTTSRAITYSIAKRDLPKVLIINCGGTIGMELQANKRIGRPANLRNFFQKFPEIHQIARIVPLPLMAKDGINLAQEDWREINKAILANTDKGKGYAGVVVCMGTDSMSYAASACAFSFGRSLSMPVVFTGAQAPNHLEHSDAAQNLLRACLIAAEKHIKEVCVVYNDSVFRAVRAEKKDDYRFDGFHSPTYHPLAIITEAIEYRDHLLLRKSDSEHSYEKEFMNNFARRIFKWSYVPGVPSNVFHNVLEKGNLQGVVMQTPGVGNVPNEGDADVLGFIEYATQKSIPVLITSLYPRRPETATAYEPAKAPLDRGAISAGSMAEPAAITKFMWVIPQVEEEIQAGTTKLREKIDRIKKLMVDEDRAGELQSD